MTGSCSVRIWGERGIPRFCMPFVKQGNDNQGLGLLKNAFFPENKCANNEKIPGQRKVLLDFDREFVVL